MCFYLFVLLVHSSWGYYHKTIKTVPLHSGVCMNTGWSGQDHTKMSHTLEIYYPLEESVKQVNLSWFHINLILNLHRFDFQAHYQIYFLQTCKFWKREGKQGNTALTQNWTFNNIRLLNRHNIVLIVLSTFISYFMVIGFMTYPLQIINIQFSEKIS